MLRSGKEVVNTIIAVKSYDGSMVTDQPENSIITEN